MSSRKIAAACATTAILLSAGDVSAHHAVNAQFDVSREITLKGRLKGIDWINPHAWFHYTVEVAPGKTEEWSFESPGPLALRRAGLSNKNQFKVGELYTIVTNPARDGSHKGTFGIVTFPDGRRVNISAVDPAAAK
jgi:hypothetical protein